MNIDNLEQIQHLDRGHALDSMQMLGKQCKQAWEESHAVIFPPGYKDVTSIVLAGMGGSNYGARIVKSLYDKNISTHVPFELTNDYALPGYVGENTLVILSSYSGSTEETLACAKEAVKRNAKIMGITSGGALGAFLTEGQYSGYVFGPKYNPSGQPRIGVGYMVMGLVGMLSSLGVVPTTQQEVEEMILLLDQKESRLSPKAKAPSNPAKQMAKELLTTIPVFIVADVLEGAVHAIRNPFHETAKHFALYFSIPELNHHLLEGLTHPAIQNLLTFVFVESTLYNTRNQQRLALTRQVVKKQGFAAQTITLEGKTGIAQTMELIQFGNFVTLYLAFLHETDPSKIPWVDYFKDQLKKEG